MPLLRRLGYTNSMSVLRTGIGPLVAAALLLAAPLTAVAESSGKGQIYLEMPRILIIIRDSENDSVYDVVNRLIDVQAQFVINENAPLFVQDRRADLKAAMRRSLEDVTFRELRAGNGALLVKERLLAAARDVLGEEAVDEVLIQHLTYR